MTKVVYNACFGGFGLSDKAIQRYSELSGLDLIFIKGEYRGHWENNGVYWSDLEIPRTDPALVQVVEELGKEANDHYSELMIIDVPPGTKYRIDYYDGKEQVMTIDEYHWEVA